MSRFTKIAALLIAIAMIASLAACGSTNGGGGGGNAPAADNADRHYAVDKDTVVVCTADETPAISARGHSAVAGNYINQLTYEQLIQIDKNLAPQPWLAESYEYTEQSDGAYLWTFHLHKGVKFHDGTEMHAEDVVASLEAAAKSPEVQINTTSFRDPHVIDEYTVGLYTDGPSAAVLYDLSGHGNAIEPKALIDSGNDFNAKPIGTGPYKFVNWKISEQLEFTRFDDYWNKDRMPAIKNIIWKIIPEGSARTIALQAHEVDYIIELDTNDIDLIKGDDGLVLLDVPSLGFNFLCLNNTVDPFGNVNVRRAINAAVNRDDIITVALNGEGMASVAQTTYGFETCDTTGFVGYNVEKAKEFAAASGVDLSKVSFEVICSDDTKRRAGQVIQENLDTAFGMGVELVSMDLATYLSQTAQGNFEGFIGGYTGSNMVTWIKGLFHSTQIGGSNKTRTNDPKVDAMIEEITRTIDTDKRIELENEFTRYMNDLCPQVPIYQVNKCEAYNKYLGDIFLGPSGRFYCEEWAWQ
ncbi:MAG: ABC transporter substrate-binding protein [Firmicutes bacterium]|nr:ABC transporter substrate-binding protein [Bacillota bacterium]